MHFLDLPNELLRLIAGCLNFECDINSLYQANARLYLLLGPTLYQHNVRYSNSSALEWAAENGHEATARKAQEAGASANCNYNGWKPIDLAVVDGHDALVRLFLEQGVNPNPNPGDPQQDSAMRSPLVLAAINDYESVVRLLLEHGAIADRPVMGKNQTPLSVVYIISQIISPKVLPAYFLPPLFFFFF